MTEAMLEFQLEADGIARAALGPLDSRLDDLVDAHVVVGGDRLRAACQLDDVGDHPAPLTPNAGIGPRPKIRTGATSMWMHSPATTTPAGTSISPEPRSTLASELTSHRKTAPPNTAVE